jgi:hypothetical protein
MRQSPCAVVMGEDYNLPVGTQQMTLYQAELSLRNRSCSFRLNESVTLKRQDMLRACSKQAVSQYF